MRVSTAKQGEQGVSLQQQRDAITRFTERNSFYIHRWFEERETAAERGRPMFNEIIEGLRAGEASGLIVHKIDRSARNLKDWAEIGELIDQGVEVHFANEFLDLQTRGGRLSADIQAVVAADYIRNLKEEARKGYYGRLKQGVLPRPAPLGYLDAGPGKPKLVDPVSSPLIKRAFELYGTGSCSIENLVTKLHSMGLRSKAGRKVYKNPLNDVLRNPFYMGLIRIEKTGEIFQGAHTPLIDAYLFELVQAALRSRVKTHRVHHEFIFKRLLQCHICKAGLIAEKQKGHVYYRCHTSKCPTACVRETTVEQDLIAQLRLLELSPAEKTCIQDGILRIRHDWRTSRKTVEASLQTRIAQHDDRLNRLTDAFVDGALDKQLFQQRKTALLLERREATGNLFSLSHDRRDIPLELEHCMHLAGNALAQYQAAQPDEKRELIKLLTSNRLLHGKKLTITLESPFHEIAARSNARCGGPPRDTARTWDLLLKQALHAISQGLLGENALWGSLKS